MPIEEESVAYIDRDWRYHTNSNTMINRGSNRFSNNTEGSNGMTRIYRSPDAIPLKADVSGINCGSNLPSMSVLEQGIADMYSYGSIGNASVIEDYRGRVSSDEIRSINQQRLLPYLRRASSASSEILQCPDVTQNCLPLNRPLADGTSHLLWNNPEFVDETKLRDVCIQEAQKCGFIVGEELELVKAKSHRSVIQNTPDRIINSFKDRYGQADSTSKKAYLQLGVRVPSKEHVSEIVGKQGSKIKQIREKTGALITTPGEQEDHVFIIEAPPKTAVHVAQLLKNRAEDITLSRTQENRRRSSCPTTNTNRHTNKSPGSGGTNQSLSKIVLASGRIQVPKIIVGRIIGTQGSIITTIQRDTGTEIRSPPKEVGKPKNSMADFEILVYQTSNLTDIQEANQRVLNAKQLIAHVAMHQLEKVRAEEAPYSNYQVQSTAAFLSVNSSNNGIVANNDVVTDGEMSRSCNQEDHINSKHSNKELLLTEQMKPQDWIWPDIEKLDDNLAHEVVDRILEESKKKTKTRSEPAIYDNTSNNLFTVGESDSFSGVGSDSSRPRYSLPETRTAGTHLNVGLDALYRNEPFSTLPYSNNDNFLPDSDSDFRSSPSISFINCRDINTRHDISENEILDFQTQDFLENQPFPNSDLMNNVYGTPQMSKSREQSLMHQLYHNDLSPPNINSRDMSGRIISRLFVDNNFGNGKPPKLESLSNQSHASNNTSYTMPPYAFDQHWSYSTPVCHVGGGTTVSNVNNNYIINNNHSGSSIKSYAESVKPLMNNSVADMNSGHGIIGEHLRRGASNNIHFK